MASAAAPVDRTMRQLGRVNQAGLSPCMVRRCCQQCCRYDSALAQIGRAAKLGNFGRAIWVAAVGHALQAIATAIGAERIGGIVQYASADAAQARRCACFVFLAHHFHLSCTVDQGASLRTLRHASASHQCRQWRSRTPGASPYASPSFCASPMRCNLPVAPFGISSMNRIFLGTL